MLICLWYLPDLELIFCKLTPNAVWNNPLNAGLSWVLYIKHHEIHKHTQGVQHLCNAGEYLLCSEGTSTVQSCGALGQPGDGSGCPLGRGQQARGVSHHLLATREERRLFLSWQNGAGGYSSMLQSSGLQQHIIMRKSKLLRFRDFRAMRSVLNSTNYQLEA